MYEKRTRGGRVLIVAAVALLLVGCAYGRPFTYSNTNPLSGIVSGTGLGQVFGQGTGGINQLPIIGPLVDTVLGGLLGYNNGYGYNGGYYGGNYGNRYGNDRYYGNRYGYNPYYDNRNGNDPYYGNPYYGDRYDNGYPDW
jgi:hypothetical protein